ncbi:hypothetical protein HRR81_006224, partial [Exophiala dermatitidis]
PSSRPLLGLTWQALGRSIFPLRHPSSSTTTITFEHIYHYGSVVHPPLASLESGIRNLKLSLERKKEHPFRLIPSTLCHRARTTPKTPFLIESQS